MFIRLFADTTGSAVSNVALEYMRSLMRAAPVRLISVSGPLAGRWLAYSQLMATPMLGDFVNCVACDPARWSWIERVPMGDRPLDVGQIGDGKELTVPGGEIASGRVDLYTHGKRNVLFAIVAPRSQAEVAAAQRYEAIVIPGFEPPVTGPNSNSGLMWAVIGRLPVVIPVPVSDHKAIRDVVGL